MPDLAKRLRELRTCPRRIVIVVKGIEAEVNTAVEQSGLGSVPRERPLPFPGQWHRAAYLSELTGLVRDWRHGRLLLAAS